MEGAALERGEALARERVAAVDEHRVLGAVEPRPVGDGADVGLVVLAEVGGEGVGDAPRSRIQASAQHVSRPPEKAIPTRSPTGSEREDDAAAPFALTRRSRSR